MEQRDVSKSIQDSYRRIASEYKRKVKSHDLDHRFIEKFLSRFSPGRKILDLGAGTGIVSNEIQENHQLDVTAVDLSKEMVDLAKHNYPGLKVIKMDLRKLEFPSSSFDGVFANYSLIHISESDVPSALEEIRRILKEFGYLYLALQEPITPMDKDGYYPVVYKRDVKMFINLFKETEIRSYLQGAGFKIVEVNRRKPQETVEFPFNKLFVTAQKR